MRCRLKILLKPTCTKRTLTSSAAVLRHASKTGQNFAVRAAVEKNCTTRSGFRGQHRGGLLQRGVTAIGLGGERKTLGTAPGRPVGQIHDVSFKGFFSKIVPR